MIYLVDYENVGMTGIEGMKYLTQADKVVLFYTKNNHVPSIPSGLNCQVSLELVNSGHNALDFQLASYLGYILNYATDITVISKDKGFCCVQDFWLSRLSHTNVRIQQFECIAYAIKLQPVELKSAKKTSKKAAKKAAKKAEKDKLYSNTLKLWENRFKTFLPDAYSGDITTIAAIFVSHLENNYADIRYAKLCPALNKKLGTVAGTEIYKLIKKNVLKGCQRHNGLRRVGSSVS